MRGYYDEEGNFIEEKESKSFILIGNYFDQEKELYCLVLQDPEDDSLYTSFTIQHQNQVQVKKYQLSFKQSLDLLENPHFKQIFQIQIKQRYRRQIRPMKLRKKFRFY